MRWKTLALFLLMSSRLYAVMQQDMDVLEIEERIEPLGKVRVQQSESSQVKKSDESTELQVKKRSAQVIYEQYCIICHRDGLAGAPKFQNASEWKPRLAGKTIEDILQIAINGLNAMPPKGTCVDCSDEELKAAIQYMLPTS